MSTLLVDEMYPGVSFSQPIKITENIMVSHIRPWIYKHNTLTAGDFQLEVYDGATLLATSTLNYITINAGFIQNYAHGYIRFDFDALQLNVPEDATEKEYILKFSMINHTLDANNFIGMVRQYEQKIYPTYGDGVVDNESPNDYTEPAGIEIYQYLGV